MKQSRKDFIKQAHENACSDWKKNIEKEFPKLFKKDSLEVGKWYKFGDTYLLRIENVNGVYGKLSGFKNGLWHKSDEFRILGGIYEGVPATDKEVEQALIKEAKKRGFREGVGVVSKGYRDSEFDGEFRFEEWDKNTLDGFGTGDIFKHGIWATIKETITKEQAEKELGKTILN